MQNEITELRNQVRTLKKSTNILWGVLILGSIILISNLNGIHSSVRANEFIVVNKDGKEVVLLAENTDGGGVIVAKNAPGASVEFRFVAGGGGNRSLLTPF